MDIKCCYSKLLTPKILCVILPNSVVFDIGGKINSSKKKNANLRKYP